MASKNRDEFIEKTKLQIAKRAGWLCSDPSCRRPTIGSTSDGKAEINLGVAAHICAAAPGGPRYDPDMTHDERRSASNGIWMCKLHGSSVDSNDPRFTVELLMQWKEQAEKDSWRRVLYNDVPVGPVIISEEELITRVRNAVTADIEVFRRSDKWPLSGVALTIKVKGLAESVSTSALAIALSTLGNLILVAQPGMGKTTTLFQVAHSVLTNGSAFPVIIPLADWATDNSTLLESILKRPAFSSISEANLRDMAVKCSVILLLDGWNELDVAARQRVTVQLARLQAELPELGFLISTRKQVLDVPLDGTRIDILPLNDKQQLEIARALRGDTGVRMVEQAWRTSGVRELVTIPLYLTALLALSEGAPFPNTKEEVLGRFVAVHEEDIRRVEAFSEVTLGMHQRFLEDLAVTGTRFSSTSISESNARRSVAETDDALVAEGQITEKPQPKTLLEALVNHHLLVRVGDPAGYSFQHQQFQEWYASFFVERMIRLSIDNVAARDELKADVLNQPAWEEAILFACERLARGDKNQQEACSVAILAACEVDPMLAAEMIGRTTDLVWARVGLYIQKFVERWHTPEKVDRALRFMMRSGRPEFFNQVWPLITHENNQVQLSALRSVSSFRTSLLGTNADKRIKALSRDVRRNVLLEIAFNSGLDGLDLVAAVAKDEPDPELKVAVVNELILRRADLHIANVLRDADEKTFDLVARHDFIDEVDDEHVKEGVAAARKRRIAQGISAYDRLREIVYDRPNDDFSDDLTTIITEMEIGDKGDPVVRLIYAGRDRYLRAIANALVQRVRTGRALFRGANDIVASAGFIIEDDALLKIALSETDRHDIHAKTAAAVLGPKAVGYMIEAIVEVKKQLYDVSGKYNQAAADRYHDLLARVEYTPGSSVIAAISARAKQARNAEMEMLATLLSRHLDGESNRGDSFDANALAAIYAFAEDWGNRMLASGDATRPQLASIATLVSRAPSLSLLQLVKRLLDEELRRYCTLRKEAAATDWQSGEVTNKARTLYTHQYQSAFQAINASETAELMREYLNDEHFGQLAAQVLAEQWVSANEPTDVKLFRVGMDFSRVGEKRDARAGNPSATSEAAEVIFDAIKPLIVDEATEDQKQHAVALGVIAARLPHGQRDATIQRLISLAPRRSRAALLRSLILSGEGIDIDVVKDGIDEVFEAAKTQSWILWEGYELNEWLHILPFASPSANAFAVLQTLPDHQSEDRLRGIVAAFGMAPGIDAENVLFKLAEVDPKLYTNHDWRNAVIRRGTITASQRFINLAASGALEDNGVADQLSGLIREYPELKTYVYQLLNDGTALRTVLLAQAVAEAPDADGLLLLVKIEIEHKCPLISWRAIENVITEHRPSENWKGAYNVVPIPAVELRRKLLAMTTDGGPTDRASHCLHEIDKIRDEYGTPDAEPRHPDIMSGKPWPVLVPDSDIEGSV